MLSLVNHGLSAWGEEGPSGRQVISFPISHLKMCVVGRWDDPPHLYHEQLQKEPEYFASEMGSVNDTSPTLLLI